MFVRSAILAALAAVVLFAASTPLPIPSSCNGQVNTIPVWTEDPKYVRSVPNGKLYIGGGGNDTFPVLHLYGTPYEMGYAQGQLMAAELTQVGPLVISFFERILQQQNPSLPPYIIDKLVEYGGPLLLEMTYNATKDFTPVEYMDEIRGLADGSGVDVKDIIYFNLFPELTRADCTIVGATGEATANGKIAQLRGLDYSVHAALKDIAQVTVYHPKKGPSFANFGWTGMIGVLTALSNVTIGVGEKLWANHPSGIYSMYGEPWMYILREVITSHNMTEALDIMRTRNRTAAIHVGVGDSTTNTFNGLTIAGHAYDVYNWSSLNWQGHPIIRDVFYWDKHAQPSNDPCLADLLQQYYGEIDAETLALKIAAPFRTGDLHCATLDYENNVVYFANARKFNVTEGDINAFNRQFTRVDLMKMWNVTQ